MKATTIQDKAFALLSLDDKRPSYMSQKSEERSIDVFSYAEAAPTRATALYHELGSVNARTHPALTLAADSQSLAKAESEEVAAQFDARDRLLAKEDGDGRLSREEKARLNIAQARLASRFPRAKPADFEFLVDEVDEIRRVDRFVDYVEQEAEKARRNRVQR